MTIPTHRSELHGRNLYLPHPLMINSGQFWRCSHGRTGIDGNGNMVGCVPCRAELDEAERAERADAERLQPTPGCDIHVSMEARYERERTRFWQILLLMGMSKEEVRVKLRNMNEQIKAHPTGSLVLTHGPVDVPDEGHACTFHNLVAMWWQDDHFGSEFNELLWMKP